MSDPSAGRVASLSESSREYTAIGLPPRTSYIFKIEGLNHLTFDQVFSVNLTVNTSEPQGELLRYYWLCCDFYKLLPDLGFLLDGQLYGNNSVVTVTDIGSSFFMSALFCLTPSLECCGDSETPNAASVTREWYLPDGTPVPSAGTVFSREQVSSAVALYRSGGTSPSGVYRCEIPDTSGTSQNIYVGVYSQGAGKLQLN